MSDLVSPPPHARALRQALDYPRPTDPLQVALPPFMIQSHVLFLSFVMIPLLVSILSNVNIVNVVM